MTDSIPQQAGPGAGADDVFWLYELTKGEGVYQGCRGPKAEWIMRQTVSGIEEAGEPFPVYLAAPLAVEDSRERCARMLTDAELREVFVRPGAELFVDVQRKFCEVNGIRLAAMAAASSGKENWLSGITC